MAIRTNFPSSPSVLALLVALPLSGEALMAQDQIDKKPATAPEVKPAQPEVPRYRWVEGFGRREDGKALGSTHGCMCVDKQGRILVNTDTEQAVLFLSPDGVVQGGWGKEFRGGLHGMTLRVERETEFLYLAHTTRGEVVKATIDGEIVWTLGWPEASGIYKNESEYHPTAVVTSSDGRIFVGDGYGKSWVHIYDQDRKLVKSIGGPGREPGKFHTPHGLCIDTRGEQELLLVCDRENHRLQWFTLDGEFVRESREGMLRPCNVWPLDGGMLAVADLVGRVTILDAKDMPIAVLGDAATAEQKATNQIHQEQWKTDVFFAPHSVCADGKGNLYVMDWNVHGRVSKLERVR